jgi:hypothetical protein
MVQAANRAGIVVVGLAENEAGEPELQLSILEFPIPQTRAVASGTALVWL